MRNLIIDFLIWLESKGKLPFGLCTEYHYQDIQQLFREGFGTTDSPETQATNSEKRFRSRVMPVLAERGRRVFGNLKQSLPKTVNTLDENMPSHLILLEPAPGGNGGVIGRAYIVDNLLDLQCLHLALYGSMTDEGWVEDPWVMYKGIPVLHAGQASEVKNG